jgi:hypothetical protein
MSNELQPTPPYDPEVEKRRIEASQATQKGWQEVVTNAIEAIKGYAIRSKEIEQRSFWIVLSAIVILVLVVAWLTWLKIVPAEGLTFLVGIVVGYLISLSPLARTIGR